MIAFVTWLWAPHRHYRSQFCATHVNTLAAMVRRNYSKPMRFLCVTDISQGIDRSVEIVTAWNDFSNLASPHGPTFKQPSCYRRLRAFHPDVGKVLGERFVSMDLDTVIVNDITPLFDRAEDFVCWAETDPRSYYNGSLFMLRAGSRPQVWTKFDPKTSPAEAKRAGRFGSDQSWLSHCLGNGEATWTQADGVYSYRIHIQTKGGVLPDDARVVNCHGGQDPWGREMSRLDWVREHYRLGVAEKVAC